MFCVHCGVELAPNGKFCQGCGKPAGSEDAAEPKAAEPIDSLGTIASPPPFNGLRKVNWGLAILLASGLALMLIRASSVASVTAIMLFGTVFLSFPLISAVALGSEDFSMFGVYINIDPANRRRLRLVGLVLNWIICGFGAIGLVACIATGQFGAMASMLIYVLPPAMNIKALRELRRFERATYEPELSHG